LSYFRYFPKGFRAGLVGEKVETLSEGGQIALSSGPIASYNTLKFENPS
jgi:hypothetical protein